MKLMYVGTKKWKVIICILKEHEKVPVYRQYKWNIETDSSYCALQSKKVYCAYCIHNMWFGTAALCYSVCSTFVIKQVSDVHLIVMFGNNNKSFVLYTSKP